MRRCLLVAVFVNPYPYTWKLDALSLISFTNLISVRALQKHAHMHLCEMHLQRWGLIMNMLLGFVLTLLLHFLFFFS